jgi:putative transposase
MHYIEMNPVLAGVVARAADYAWSSHRRYAAADDGANSAWLEPHAQYLALGRTAPARHAAYAVLFKTLTPLAQLTAIRDATNKYQQ